MKRFMLVAAAMASVLLLGVSSAGANQPAEHFTQDVTGDTLQCGDTTYTIVSGEIAIVMHEGQSASGNTNFTGTITPRNVVLQDQAGNLYSLAGAIWFGATSTRTPAASKRPLPTSSRSSARAGGRWTASTPWSTSAPTGRSSSSTSGPAGKARPRFRAGRLRPRTAAGGGRPQAGLKGGCRESSYEQVKPMHGPLYAPHRNKRMDQRLRMLSEGAHAVRAQQSSGTTRPE